MKRSSPESTQLSLLSSPLRPSQRPLSVHFSSRNNEWATPQWLFDALDAEFGFTLDPCSTDENSKCAKHYTKAENGLRQDWSDEVAFMNPPYSNQIGRFMKKAYDSTKAGATVVCLVPARTDTSWWHGFAMKGEIRLMKGRLKFENAKHSAPFPSAIIVFRPRQFALRATLLPCPPKTTS